MLVAVVCSDTYDIRCLPSVLWTRILFLDWCPSGHRASGALEYQILQPCSLADATAHDSPKLSVGCHGGLIKSQLITALRR